MAQYGKNFYGTAYYGRTNAFVGWYETKEIFTDEVLNDVVNISIRAALPTAVYGPTAPEVTQIRGTWAYSSSLGKISSDQSNAELLLKATCDEFTIKYEQRTVAASVTIEVTTIQPGKANVVTTKTLNTQSTTVNANATYKVSGLPYGDQRVRIFLSASNPAGSAFNFKGFMARTANLTVETRARLNNTAWPEPADSAYLASTLSYTAINGAPGEYMVTGKTPNYAGKNKVQLRIYMASSDTGTSPEVMYIETTSGNTNNRAADGQWSAVFNMVEIAKQAGTSFSKVEEVAWTENVPASTSITIRSQSSSDNNVIWDKVTVPYKQGVNRIRLKEGYNTGWIDSPFIAPASKKPYVNTVEWDRWNDQSFLPPDSAGVTVTYDFLSIQKDNAINPYMRILNPMNQSDKNLRGTALRNLDNILRITLKRSANKQTPVVDFVKIASDMHYQQDVITEDQEFSAIDNNNTGKVQVLDTSTTAFRNKFKVPTEVSSPDYVLIDETRRPQDVALYLNSEKDLAIRTNKTLSLTGNSVWAEAKVNASNSKTGLIKNYQYGGGQVKFPLKDEIQMAPIFTPSLKDKVRYRYFLDAGWPQQFHTVVEGDTMEEIANNYGKTANDFLAINPNPSYNNNGTLVAGQNLKIPNDTHNDDVNIYWKSNNSTTTSKSSHNAVIEENVNVESDSIVAEVKEASIYGWVDWVSEEKIYDGVINLNDIRSEYKRTHLAPASGTSTQISYVAVSGDTYKKIANRFGVYEEDVRKLNGVVADQEPMVGEKVQVPSRIVLPEVHPKAVVTDNPYNITIVYNSVKKKDGKVLTTSSLFVKPIEITYKQVTMQDVEVVRGNIANGKDLLKHARVVSIIKAQNLAKTRVYNPYNATLKTGDFKKTDNYIDWSPVDSPATEPAKGETYLVDYIVEVPERVTVTIDTTYQEEGGVDRIWRSPEVKEFKGMCYPGHDFIQELPSFSEWQGLPDNNVEDIQYLVEDNDIWVKTWIEKRNGKWFIIGSLQDRVPKDNWLPTIKTGYYYLGKDEYYLFNEPIVIEPTDREVPKAENVEFVEGKFQNAAQVQEGSTNLIRNSGFDIHSTNNITYKLTFTSGGVAGLGITI